MRRIEVLPGDRYGQLTIVSEAERSVTASGRYRRAFNCRCDCGQTITVDLGNLRSGHSASCGCVKHRESPSRFKVMTGERFGRLVVISEAPTVVHGGQIRRQFKCQCDCGAVTTVSLTHLRSSHTTSCGCYRAENLDRSTHGMTATRTYAAWTDMKTRCTNAASTSYQHYGAREITICQRWMDSFEAFLEDMGECPDDALSLDRIDNNGDYSKENCRWATWHEQARNRRNNHLITCDGRTQCIAAWSEETGIPSSTISNRLKTGCSAEEALRVKLVTLRDDLQVPSTTKI